MYSAILTYKVRHTQPIHNQLSLSTTIVMLSFEPFSIAIFINLFAKTSVSLSSFTNFCTFYIWMKSHTPSLATIKYLCGNLIYILVSSGLAVSPTFFKEKSPNALVTANTPPSLLYIILPPVALSYLFIYSMRFRYSGLFARCSFMSC